MNRREYEIHSVKTTEIKTTAGREKTKVIRNGSMVINMLVSWFWFWSWSQCRLRVPPRAL